MDTDVETRTDELYALPLERFVPERDLLVKELRAAGRREEAAEVAGLAKPSIAAWAVNQVVRTQGAAARELWEAGDAILAAQERVVGGTGAGSDLRTAIDRERAALATLGGAARGLVTGSGRFLGDQNVQAVTETLHAAAVDLGLRAQVATGRATRPLQAAGLGGGVGGTGGPAPARARAASPAPAPSSPAARRLAERRRGDDTAEAERRQADRAERQHLAAAQQALARAEQARDAERERIAEAARARDAASARVEAAMAELGRAEDDLGRAEQALEAGHAALEEAEAAVDAARSAVEGA